MKGYDLTQTTQNKYQILMNEALKQGVKL